MSITINTPRFKELPPLMWELKTYIDSKAMYLSAKEVEYDEVTGEKYCSNYITVSRDTQHSQSLPKKYKKMPYVTMLNKNEDIIEMLIASNVIESKPAFTQTHAECPVMQTFKFTEFIINQIKSCHQKT